MTNRLTIIPAFLRRLAAPLFSVLVMASAITGAEAQLVNTGQAAGSPAQGALALPLPESTVSIPVAPAAPGITLIKSVVADDQNGDGHGQVGETLTYKFTVTNTGNVTLKNVSITDPSVTITGGPLVTLAPMASDNTTFTATYTLNAADILAGSHTNQASVAATSAVPGSPAGGVTDMSDSNNPADGSGPDDPTTITFTDAPIIADDENFAASPVNGFAGGNTPSVFVGDTINGIAFLDPKVIPAIINDGGLAGVTINANGTLSVPAGTPAGTYPVQYQICETANPTNCDTATASVVVTAPVIDANAETTSVVPGGIGGSATNVLVSDTYNGAPATTATVSITPASITYTYTRDGLPYVPSGGAVVLDPVTGDITVDPGTPGMVVSITYQICDILNPANCSSAVETVAVTPLLLEALPEAYPTLSSATGGTLAPVVNSDLVDSLPASLSPVNVNYVIITAPVVGDYTNISHGTPIAPGAISLDPATGVVTVAAGLPAGVYGVHYEICANNDLTNCSDIIEQFTIVAPSIIALDDDLSASPVNGFVGGTIGNVLANAVGGSDTLNGAAVNPADTTISVTDANGLTGVSIADDGTVSVPAGSPAGTYTVAYRLCEDLNTNPLLVPPTSNCDDATVTIVVTAAPILAVADTPASIIGMSGGTTPSVLVNDTLNGAILDPLKVNLTPGAAPTPTAGSITMNGDGTVTVAAGTTAGVYAYPYTICEVLNPANCDTATATVTVDAAPIDAVADSGTVANGATGGVAVADVLVNDTLNGSPATLATVSLSQVSTTDPNVTLNPATGAVDVAANTPAGTYTVTYQICEVLNPANCDTATVTVTVGAAAIAAVVDSGTLANGAAGGVVAGLVVTDNDTLNGVPVVLGGASPTVTLTSTPTPFLTVNGDGTVSVAPGTPSGPYVVAYTICEILNPTNCDTVNVTVTVDAAVILANDDVATGVNGLTGGVVAGLNILDNDSLNGVAVNPADVTVTAVTAGPLTVNSDGTVTVAAGTAAGTYLVTYQICQVLNPAVCDTAEVSVTVVIPSNTISGTVFEDLNSNGVLDGTDPVAGGYTVQLVRDGIVIATTVSNPDGTYEFDGVPAGTGYSIATIDPATGRIVSGKGTFDVTAGSVIADVNLPIDPSGIVYDSTTRLPIAGAVLQMTDTGGTPLPAVCFASPDQQPQTTPADGSYRFDIMAGSDPACPVSATTYRIQVTSPAGYIAAPSSAIAPQASSLVADSCAVDTTPGGSCAVQQQPAAPTAAQATTYFLAFVLQSGDPDVVHNHIPLDPAIVVPGDVSVVKRASSQTGVRGGVMTYTIAATNNGGAVTADLNLIDQMPAGFTLVDGSVTIDGSPATATVSGRNVTMPAVTIPASGQVIVTLQLRIPVNAAPGEYVNNAYAVDAVTGDRVGTGGSATIRIRSEAVFDCGDVIGKVFDDRNANGYQDDGEEGIAGVRLATVKGELITTDQNGQYHVPCAMLPDRKIGSNFILKLDVRTLPTGYRVTTENPRVIRLTAGKVSKLNFGASIGRVVRLDLRGDAFEAGTSALKPEWNAGLDQLVVTLAEENSTLRLTYHETDEAVDLAKARVAAVRKAIDARWKRSGGRYKLQIEVERVKK